MIFIGIFHQRQVVESNIKCNVGIVALFQVIFFKVKLAVLGINILCKLHLAFFVFVIAACRVVVDHIPKQHTEADKAQRERLYHRHALVGKDL